MISHGGPQTFPVASNAAVPTIVKTVFRGKGDVRMKAIVDRETCIGCGLCPEICPEVFKMDDENIAVVIGDVIASDQEALAKEAAASCPVEAIKIG